MFINVKYSLDKEKERMGTLPNFLLEVVRCGAIGKLYRVVRCNLVSK